MSDTTNPWASQWPTSEERPTWRRQIAKTLQRAKRAWHYACNRLTPEDAQTLFLECRDPAGWHPLDLLTVEDVTEEARDIFFDHPELPRLIAKACRQTGFRWHSNESISKARESALALVEQYADHEGLVLCKVNRLPPTALALIQPFIPKGLPAPAPAQPACPAEPTASTITEFDHAAARAEGWDLIHSGVLKDGSPNVTIQRILGEDHRHPIFPSDPAAWEHVVSRARQGSPLHTLALDLACRIERLGIETTCGTW